VQKLVTQKVLRTYLNACIGEFPADLDPLPEHFVYLVRATDGEVPTPNSSEEADEQLSAYFDVGVISGRCLEMLEQLLTQVNKSAVQGMAYSHCRGQRSGVVGSWNGFFEEPLLGLPISRQ